jgi:hypothetical protein
VTSGIRQGQVLERILYYARPYGFPAAGHYGVCTHPQGFVRKDSRMDSTHNDDCPPALCFTEGAIARQAIAAANTDTHDVTRFDDCGVKFFDDSSIKIGSPTQWLGVACAMTYSHRGVIKL